MIHEVWYRDMHTLIYGHGYYLHENLTIYHLWVEQYSVQEEYIWSVIDQYFAV